MTLASLCIGASLFGWLLPEFVRTLSPHADRFTVPLGVNFASAFSLGLMAYGVAA